MDYAVLYWIRHLEAGVVQADDHDHLMKQLAESLEVFIDLHWSFPTATFVVSKRNSERLQFFRALPFYDKLERTVASTKRQLRFFGKMKKEEIALNLVDIVGDVRKVLERIVSSPMEASVQQGIEQKYGSNLFKCPRFSCRFFTTGFPSADERDKHVGKHDRPFRCTDETCTGFVFGFTSAVEREKHMKETHSTAAVQDQEFPTDQDVQHSMQNKTMEEQATADPIESSESEPEAEPQRLPPQKRFKRARQNEFKCEHCSKVYTKRYNLKSHLLTHATDRPYKCNDCGIGFARLSDHTRHMSKHTGEKGYVCRGVLQNGDHWGCGKSFSRADILSSHHNSKIGRACRLPWLQEQEQEHSQMQGTQDPEN